MKNEMGLFEALRMVADTYGLCKVCDAEHEWANVKCDLMDESYERVSE